MRLHQNALNQNALKRYLHSTSSPLQFELDRHPVVSRAREAYRNDEIGGLIPLAIQDAPHRGRITYSAGLIGDAQAQGVSEADVLAALGSGSRERRWDGCLIVRDWFLGLEVQLDPTGQHGMALRRVG